MPSSKNYKRDYKQEAKAESPARKKARAQRMRARRAAVKAGKVSTGDGAKGGGGKTAKTLDHKKPIRSGGTNAAGNIRVQSKSENSSRNGHRPGGPQGAGGRPKKK